MDETNQFEKLPGGIGENKGENLQETAKWAAAMAEGTPEFAGPKMLGGTGEGMMKKTLKMGEQIGEAAFGNANETNEFYGESKDEQGEVGDGQSELYDDGMEGAKSLTGALNDAVNKYGVELVIQKLKGFDASGSSDPIGDLYTYMGIGTAYESERPVKTSASGESADAAASELTAIEDMKELINEVEGADPRYESLRQGAKASGKGYFEYAVSNFGVQGLPELFQVLEEQKETVEVVEQEPEEPAEEELNNKERLNPEITRGNAA